jgi:hypothetical protein
VVQAQEDEEEEEAKITIPKWKANKITPITLAPTQA